MNARITGNPRKTTESMYTTLIEAELTFPVYIKSDSYKFIHFLDTPQSMYFQSINSV